MTIQDKLGIFMLFVIVRIGHAVIVSQRKHVVAKKEPLSLT